MMPDIQTQLEKLRVLLERSLELQSELLERIGEVEAKARK